MSLDFTKSHERFTLAHHGHPALFLRVALLRARFTCPSVTCDLRQLAGDCAMMDLCRRNALRGASGKNM